MEPRIWVTKVENSSPGSKSLKIGPQIVWNMRKNISKICRGRFLLPKIMAVLRGPEIKIFLTGSHLIFFWKASQKLLNKSVKQKKSSILRFRGPLNSVLNSVLSRGLWAFPSLGRIDVLGFSVHLSLFWSIKIWSWLIHSVWVMLLGQDKGRDSRTRTDWSRTKRFGPMLGEFLNRTGPGPKKLGNLWPDRTRTNKICEI